MKRICIAFVSLLLVVVLSACGNLLTDYPEAEDYISSEEVAAEPTTPEPDPEALPQAMTWQEAYADFLRTPANFHTDMFELPQYYSYTFALRDFTGDGTPELLVYYIGDTMSHGSGFLVYRFAYSEVSFCDNS